MLLDGALERFLAKAGTPPTTLDTTAKVTFVPGTGITEIGLSVVGDVPGISAEDFQAEMPGTSPTTLMLVMPVPGTNVTLAVVSSVVGGVPAPGITEIVISVVGDVPGISAEDFQAAAEDAKANCPVSQALKAVPISLEAKLLDWHRDTEAPRAIARPPPAAVRSGPLVKDAEPSGRLDGRLQRLEHALPVCENWSACSCESLPSCSRATRGAAVPSSRSACR